MKSERTTEKDDRRKLCKEEAFGVSIPKVRKDFTDVEKDNFLEEAFNVHKPIHAEGRKSA